MIEFTIARVSETKYAVSWTSNGKGFDFNYTRDPDEHRAWGPPMRHLASWRPDELPPAGVPVSIELDLLALQMPDGSLQPIVAGEVTNFKGIDFALDAAGKKVHDHWWPGAADGTGPAYSHIWETWPLPEPEPEPEPEEPLPVPVPDPFTVVVAEDGAGLYITWKPSADTATEFRIGAVGSAWNEKALTATPVGLSLVMKTSFILLDSPLADGESLEVQAMATRGDDGARSEPSSPVVVTYTLVVIEPDPDPDPEPEPEPGLKLETSWVPLVTPMGKIYLQIGREIE